MVMREIKFRQWNPKHKHMIYDCNFPFDLNNVSLNKVISLSQGVGTIWMQHTGLKDMNKKEVYEGDVIRNIKYKFNALIMWGIEGESYAGWCFKRLDDKEEYPRMGLLYNKNLENCKVIGNIYENPDLLH